MVNHIWLIIYTAFLLFVQVINFYVNKNIIFREICLGHVRLDVEYEDGYHPLDLGAIDLICQHEILEQSVLDWGFGLVLPKEEDAKQSELHVFNTKVCYEYCSCVTVCSMVQNHPMGSRNCYIKYNFGG